MKKLVCLALALLLVGAMAVGCLPKPADPAPAPAPAEPKPADPVAPAEPAEIENPTVEQLLEMDWAKIEEYAKKEGEVVFFAWHDEDFFQKLCMAFTEKYGIKATFVFADHNAGVDKALAEKDGAVGSFDVMKVGGETTKTTIAAGIYAGPILAKMENGDKLDPGLSARQEGVEHQGYLVPLHLNQTGLLYNPAKVENPPQTFAELEAWIDANPKKFGFCIPDKGGSGQAFVHAVIGATTGGLDQYYGDEECDPAKLEKWSAVWEWINARKDKMTFTASNNDSLARMNQGELDLVVAWDDNAYRTMKNGELFKEAKLYIPEFGMTGGGDTVGVMKNAAHPAAAMLLVNFLTSDQGQQMFIDEMNAFPARVDLPTAHSLIDPAEMQKYRIAWTPACYKAQFIADFTQYVLMGG